MFTLINSRQRRKCVELNEIAKIPIITHIIKGLGFRYEGTSCEKKELGAPIEWKST